MAEAIKGMRETAAEKDGEEMADDRMEAVLEKLNQLQRNVAQIQKDMGKLQEDMTVVKTDMAVIKNEQANQARRLDETATKDFVGSRVYATAFGSVIIVVSVLTAILKTL